MPIQVVPALEDVMCAAVPKPAPTTLNCDKQPLCPVDVDLTTTAEVCGEDARAAQQSFEATVLASSGASGGTFKFCDDVDTDRRRRLGADLNNVAYRLLFSTPSNAAQAQTTMTTSTFSESLLQDLKVADEDNFGAATVGEVQAVLVLTYAWDIASPECRRECGLAGERVVGTVHCRDNYGDDAALSACSTQVLLACG